MRRERIQYWTVADCVLTTLTKTVQDQTFDSTPQRNVHTILTAPPISQQPSSFLQACYSSTVDSSCSNNNSSCCCCCNSNSSSWLYGNSSVSVPAFFFSCRHVASAQLLSNQNIVYTGIADKRLDYDRIKHP